MAIRRRLPPVANAHLRTTDRQQARARLILPAQKDPSPTLPYFRSSEL